VPPAYATDSLLEMTMCSETSQLKTRCWLKVAHRVLGCWNLAQKQTKFEAADR